MPNAIVPDVDAYFNVDDKNANCSDNEIVYYSSLFFPQSESVKLAPSVGKSAGSGWVSYLRYIAAYLCESYNLSTNGVDFRRYVSLVKRISRCRQFPVRGPGPSHS